MCGDQISEIRRCGGEEEPFTVHGEPGVLGSQRSSVGGGGARQDFKSSFIVNSVFGDLEDPAAAGGG